MSWAKNMLRRNITKPKNSICIIYREGEGAGNVGRSLEAEEKAAGELFNIPDWFSIETSIFFFSFHFCLKCVSFSSSFPFPIFLFFVATRLQKY